MLFLRSFTTGISRQAREFRTWADLLFPVSQIPRISIRQVDETPLAHNPSNNIAIFASKRWDAERLRSRIHLVPNMHWKMHEHLRRMINSDKYYLDRSQESQYTRPWRPSDEPETPKVIFRQLQQRCEEMAFAYKN
jgi:hypothetical protein